MRSMANNLQKQIDIYTDALERELSKTKAWWDPFGWFTGKDEDKIKAYRQALDGLKDDLHDLALQMKQDFLQTDAASFVNQLVDTWTAGYESIADRRKAMEDNVVQMFKNIAKEAMLAKVVIKPIDALLDNIYNMGMDSLNMDVVRDTQDKINKIFTDAWKWLEPFWNDLSDMENQFQKDIMKAAKVFTEEQGNILLGHLVAMRLNMDRQVNELILQTSILRAQQKIQEHIDTNVGNILGVKSSMLSALKNHPLMGTGL